MPPSSQFSLLFLSQLSAFSSLLAYHYSLLNPPLSTNLLLLAACNPFFVA
jgi:hypothetical protein